MKYEACKITIMGFNIGYRCSKCMKRFDDKEPLCPHCGTELKYKKERPERKKK